ncbi:FixH family protein [Alteribacillus bidgolensis]|uniref:FixH family protein n=1 Tax=Alteribacillus bidgolensis TaxID=930129 RepID=UPI001FEAB6E5|nr:FixH family protein [Alteribacillus bidgolensis]
MKIVFHFFSIFIFLLLLSACTVDTSTGNLYKQSQPLEVDMILPKSTSLNKEQVIKIQLTQEGKKVDDAAAIQFEIWKKETHEDHEVVKAKHEGNGIYFAEKTFNEDGLYYIKADVRARDLHVMPTKQVIVGNPSEEELNALQQKTEHPHGDHNHH